MQQEFSATISRIIVDGITLEFSTAPDGAWSLPWVEEDGHGPVREVGRDDCGRFPKRPGELLMWQDGGGLYHGRAYLYDFAGACRQALAEGWDAAPYNQGQETPRQQAAKAARSDFKRLRAWCRDEWHYCGVIVTATRAGLELGSASIWGIESDASGYHWQAANELIEDALDEARAKLAELCNCMAA